MENVKLILEFSLISILNPDGVYLGNYRYVVLAVEIVSLHPFSIILAPMHSMFSLDSL
jgi:hypothetical protein